jgi:ComF family protein
MRPDAAGPLRSGSLGAMEEAVNLKGLDAVDGIAARLVGWVLPSRCLLCGAPGAHGRDLCAACSGDLLENRTCCPRCALPLAVAAPSCGECLGSDPPFTAAWVPFRYAHPLDLLEARFKFHADLAAGRVLASLMTERMTADGPARPRMIVPVPLHGARLGQRGYNQALELARPLARAAGIPLRDDLLRRVRATPAQTGLDAKARRANLRDAFAVSCIDPPDHVVLFDDVMTTGATLREAARSLRKAGVQRVDAWALARAPLR